MLGLLRQQWQDLYSQATSAGASSASPSLLLDSAASPHASAVSAGAASRDVFSSIAPGSSPASSRGSLWSAAGQAGAAGGSPRYTVSAFPASPGRQGPSDLGEAVGAHMAALRLRSVVAEREAELRERRRWQPLDGGAAVTRAARPAEEGVEEAPRAPEGGHGLQHQERHGLPEGQQQQQPEGAGGVELLYQHLLAQERRLAEEEARQQQQRRPGEGGGRQESLGAEGASDEVGQFGQQCSACLCIADSAPSG